MGHGQGLWVSLPFILFDNLELMSVGSPVAPDLGSCHRLFEYLQDMWWLASFRASKQREEAVLLMKAHHF